MTWARTCGGRARLREGQRLTEVTADLATALGVAAHLLPMTDSPVRTELLTADGWLEFQEYFVHRHHADAVTALRYRGAETAVADRGGAGRDRGRGPAGARAIQSVPEHRHHPGRARHRGRAAGCARAPVVAVSPIVGGAALRGPADRLFETLGGEASALGVARHYQDRYPGLVDALVIDDVDAAASDAIRDAGLEVLVTGTVMLDHADRERLATTILDHWLPAG